MANDNEITTSNNYFAWPGFAPGMRVSLKPRPQRPSWWKLALLVPWIRWRWAIKRWQREDCYTITEVKDSTTLKLGR